MAPLLGTPVVIEAVATPTGDAVGSVAVTLELFALDAEDVEIKVWTNDVLKLDPNTIGLLGSPTQVKKIFAPEREKGEVIMGEGENKDQAVETLFSKLIVWDVVSVE